MGAVLVLTSTVLGARLLGTSDSGVTVWAARHDLPAGLTVRAGDLEPRQVQLDSGVARYVAASATVPADLVLARPVGGGELLPVAAVAAPGTPPDLRVVTVPVEQFHVADDLGAGEKVDVYVTPRGSGDSAAGASRLLAAGVDVVDVEQDGGGFGGSGSTRGVAVAVPVASVAALVGGLGGGTVDLVRVSGGQR